MIIHKNFMTKLILNWYIIDVDSTFYWIPNIF